MPSFAGATEWLNYEPLGPAELHGHVVLVSFWTLTSINWLRHEPYVRAWSQAYRDDGLIVIGVHTSEFSFEHDVELVRHATKVPRCDGGLVELPAPKERVGRLVSASVIGATNDLGRSPRRVVEASPDA